MVSNPKYLITIGDTYYFRLRVPKHIKGLYSETHIKRSLQTKNLQSALHKATILRQLVLLVFKQLEEEMTQKDKAKELLSIFTKKVVTKDSPFSCIPELSIIDNPDIPPAGDDGAFKAIERQNKAVAKAVEEAKGSVYDLMSKLSERLSDTTVSKAQPKYLVKDLQAKFISEKMNDGSWDETTLSEYKPFLSLFEEYLGNVEVGKVTTNDLIGYRDDVLQKYPKNRYKYFKDLEDALKDKSKPKISLPRANCYLVTVISFFIWCEKRDYITKNPAVDLTLKDRRVQKEKKTRYNKQELEKIIIELSQLPARGKVDHRRNVDRIWIILIGLYSGFRQNEICQLYIDNIFSTDGIPCMQVVKDEIRRQRGKNISSYRTIPIHETLLQLGFLNFVNARKRLSQ